MKISTSIFILLIACINLTWAQEMQVTFEQLGELEQKTQSIKAVDKYSGSRLLATVTELTGQSFVLNAPMNAQRVIYLKSPGDTIKAGEPFVTLIGSEVHHYYSQYQINKRLFEQSLTLFENNRKLFQNRALGENSWLDVSQKHYAIKLVYDEYVHFFEYVSHFDEKNESLTLNAPLDGVIVYKHPESIKVDDNLARFIPKDAVRLKISVPLNNSLELVSVSASHCDLAISQLGKQTESFYQTAWSATINDSCQLSIGEQVSVTPYYKTQAYEVSQRSVFNWEGDTYLFLSKNKTYYATKITLLAGVGDSYIVTSSQPLLEAKALVSSVSAAQGILMGLGE